MRIDKKLLNELKGIHDASWEQLDSVAAFEGEGMKEFILALIHMRVIVGNYALIWERAKDGGMEEEEANERQALLITHLTHLTDVVASSLGLTQKQVDSAFAWTDTIYSGAESRIQSLLEEK